MAHGPGRARTRPHERGDVRALYDVTETVRGVAKAVITCRGIVVEEDLRGRPPTQALDFLEGNALVAEHGRETAAKLVEAAPGSICR